MRTLPVRRHAAFCVIAVAFGLALSGCFLTQNAIMCDGSVPQWMLDAPENRNRGGGCAEILPAWQAPPDADWTPVCLGICLCEPPLRINDAGNGCTEVPSGIPDGSTPLPEASD